MKAVFLLAVGLFTCAVNFAQKKDNYHTFLGVDVNNTNKKTNGLYVNGVYKGYGAEKAGLKPGDSLRMINSIPVHTFNELVATLDRYEPGERVEVTFTRNSSLQKSSAVLSPYPEFLKYNLWDGVAGDEEKVIRKARLGIHIESMWEDYAVLVTGFTDNSVSQQAGLKMGDVIMKMDNYEFVSLEELTYYLSKYKAGNTVTLTVKRDGNIKMIPVKLDEEVIYIETKQKDKKKKDQQQ